MASTRVTTPRRSPRDWTFAPRAMKKMAVRCTGPTQAYEPHWSVPQAPLDSILKGVAGQVGGLLWDAPESDPAGADDDDGEGTAGVLAPA
jgi:hypothetical protein